MLTILGEGVLHWCTKSSTAACRRRWIGYDRLTAAPPHRGRQSGSHDRACGRKGDGAGSLYTAGAAGASAGGEPGQEPTLVWLGGLGVYAACHVSVVIDEIALDGVVDGIVAVAPRHLGTGGAELFRHGRDRGRIAGQRRDVVIEGGEIGLEHLGRVTLPVNRHEQYLEGAAAGAANEV